MRTILILWAVLFTFSSAVPISSLPGHGKRSSYRSNDVTVYSSSNLQLETTTHFPPLHVRGHSYRRQKRTVAVNAVSPAHNHQNVPRQFDPKSSLKIPSATKNVDSEKPSVNGSASDQGHNTSRVKEDIDSNTPQGSTPPKQEAKTTPQTSSSGPSASDHNKDSGGHTPNWYSMWWYMRKS